MTTKNVIITPKQASSYILLVLHDASVGVTVLKELMCFSSDMLVDIKIPKSFSSLPLDIISFPILYVSDS